MVSNISGVPRPGRSYYLDALVLNATDCVLCVSDIGGYFTPGQYYHTTRHTGRGGEVTNWVRDNFGEYCIPSARFVKAPDDPCDDCTHWVGSI